MKAHLKALCHRHRWITPVAVGLLLRLVAALAGHGPFASDDYLYVIRPAATWLEDPAAPFPSSIRSTLFARAFSWLLSSATLLGFADPAHLLKWAYALLGIGSLLTIPGVYALTAPRLGQRAATAAAWLTAVHPLMPRIATRALIGVACMPALVWGLVCSERARAAGIASSRRFVLAAGAGALLGVAAMVRFQVGLMWPVAFAAMLWPTRNDNASLDTPSTIPRRWPAVLGMLVGGVACVAAQAALDISAGVRPFASVWAYLTFNLAGSSKFGTSAWYTYGLLFLLLTVPPATVALARPLWRACRDHPWVALTFGVFVLAHSLIGHKEDRFIFPVLPLFFVLVGSALVHAFDRGGWSRRAVIFFVACHVPVLPFAVLSDGQRSATTPLLEVARMDSPPTYVHWVGRRKPLVFYLGGRSELVWSREPTDLLDAVEARPARNVRVIFQHSPTAQSLDGLASLGLACGTPRVYPGDLVDKVLLAVNPRHNRRRLPMTGVDCLSGIALPRPHDSAM